MRNCKWTFLLCMLLATPLIAFAQMSMPKPAPELKQLDYFVGTWKLTGDVKPGPMGPGGKMTMEEEDHWMQGGFFIVAHSKYSGGGMPDGSGISFLGYDPGQKMYTYHEFNSSGEANQAMGTFENQTFTWKNDEKMGDKVFKGRFVIKITSPTTYNFEYAVSPDGNDWTTMMTGTATKGK